jgi:hypothetical protein
MVEAEFRNILRQDEAEAPLFIGMGDDPCGIGADGDPLEGLPAVCIAHPSSNFLLSEKEERGEKQKDGYAALGEHQAYAKL